MTAQINNPVVYGELNDAVGIDGTSEAAALSKAYSVAMQGQPEKCNPNFPPIVDAFNYNLLYGFRYAMSRMRVFAQMEALRRSAAAYRPKMYRCPGNGYEAVAAYGSVQWQVKLKPGSWLWGIQVSTLLDTDAPGDNAGPAVQIWEGTSREPIFTRPAVITTAPNPVSFVAILQPPRCIEGDGTVIVTLGNNQTANEPYVLLFVAEPRS